MGKLVHQNLLVASIEGNKLRNNGDVYVGLPATLRNIQQKQQQ